VLSQVSLTIQAKILLFQKSSFRALFSISKFLFLQNGTEIGYALGLAIFLRSRVQQGTQTSSYTVVEPISVKPLTSLGQSTLYRTNWISFLLLS